MLLNQAVIQCALQVQIPETPGIYAYLTVNFKSTSFTISTKQKSHLQYHHVFPHIHPRIPPGSPHQLRHHLHFPHFSSAQLEGE
jgi:hypothetical protein